MIVDETSPQGMVGSRFWKPLCPLEEFLYKNLSPNGNEHVLQAIIAIRSRGVNDMASHMVKSNLIKRIRPDYRYRSFRNGLYQIEIDREKEPSLPWDHPDVLNGRFLPYDDPRCPEDVATETYYDIVFKREWIECQLQDIHTPGLDQLLRTQHISMDEAVGEKDEAKGGAPRRASELTVLPRPRASANAREHEEGLRRMEHVKAIMGDGFCVDQDAPGWDGNMSFVYLCALMMSGRCLRPLANRVMRSEGQVFVPTDNFQCAPLFVGTPGTGKSTLLNLICKMLHPTSTFELKANTDSKFGLGQIGENIKFVYMTELAKQMPFGVSTFNSIVEGGKAEFRRMQTNPLTKEATFTMAFAANPDQVPGEWIRDPTQGFRRRLVVFEFMVSPEKSDSEFMTRLTREGELAKTLVKFCRAYNLCKAYFDARRLAFGEFNFINYITKHRYFSTVRSQLFALASPSDQFLSTENEMVRIDPSAT